MNTNKINKTKKINYEENILNEKANMLQLSSIVFTSKMLSIGLLESYEYLYELYKNNHKKKK